MTLSNIYPHDPQTYAIIGAAIEVQRVMGCGFLEQAYRLPLKIEFTERGIPSRVNVPFHINYKGIDTGVTYWADFVCFDEIIVELKAARALTVVDEAQVINYLKVSGLKRGLLLNFGTTKLEQRRFVL
jgi:GxxExxY protein